MAKNKTHKKLFYVERGSRNAFESNYIRGIQKQWCDPSVEKNVWIILHVTKATDKDVSIAARLCWFITKIRVSREVIVRYDDHVGKEVKRAPYT